MASINQKIRDILHKDLAVQDTLSKGLINIRALAKYLIKRHELNTSLDAVISAVRRYVVDTKIKIEGERVSNIFKDSSISTRNNIASITVKRSAISRFQEIINQTEKVKSVIGTKEIKLIINEKEIDEIKQIANNSLIKVDKGLSELSITISEKGLSQKGVLARIANEISLRGVSMNNLIICPPEFLILVKQEDLLQTHEALMQLTSR